MLKQLTVKLTKEQVKQLKEIGKKKGLRPNQVIQSIIRKYLKEHYGGKDEKA